MDDKTIAIVQISGTNFEKGEEVLWEEVEDMLPCHSCWEELLDTIPDSPNDDKEDNFFSKHYDSIVNESVLGMDFSSVGDWPRPYNSFFENEIEMVGIEDVIDPFKDEIVAAIKEKFSSWVPSLSNLQEDPPVTVSILTLWTGRSWRSWEGEYDFDYDYEGVIDLSKLLQTLESKEDDSEAKED